MASITLRIKDEAAGQNRLKDIAYKEAVGTDQGTGGCWCSNCRYDLTKISNVDKSLIVSSF